MSGSTNPYSFASVRGSALAYLSGRAVSAVLTFSAFALAARVLPLDEYGVYMAALAAMETGLALSTPGLDWVAARILPEYRLHAAGKAIVRAVSYLSALQMALYFCAGSALFFYGDWVAALLRMERAADVLSLTGAVLAVEGCARLFREQVLSTLMRQGAAQLAQVLRSGVLAFLLSRDWYSGREIVALEAIHYELLAACSSAALAALLLVREMWSLRHWTVASSDWIPPNPKQLFIFAVNTYISYLLAFAYGSQMLTLIIARILGVDAAAVFGFSTSFSDQVRRYLPTDLLRSVIQPSLIAFYSHTRDFKAFMVRLGIWFKSSLIILAPVIVYFVAFGEMGAAIVGGERFRDAGPVVTLMLVGTGLTTLRRVVELSCNAVLATDLYVKGGFWLLVVPPLAVLILTLRGSLIDVVALVVCAEAFFCTRIIVALRRRGYAFRFCWRGIFRLAFLSGGIAAAFVMLSRIIQLDFPASVAACLLAMFAGVVLAKPLDSPEIEAVSGWSPRGGRLLSRLSSG